MTPFETDSTRLLEKFEQQADTLAATAAAWTDKLATAKADAVAAEERFHADFQHTTAQDLVEAQNRARNVQIAADAVESAGGPPEVRARTLRTAPVFSAFAKGFAERVAALEKLRLHARKQLGSRRAALTEAGLDYPRIENDSIVQAWGSHEASITSAMASATFGKTYSEKRGEGYKPESFDSLFAQLTAPLPQAPQIATT